VGGLAGDRGVVRTAADHGASDVYGVFAIVLGMLAWLYLAAHVLLVSAEVNVVLRRHLWPRSLFPRPTLEADRVVLAQQAEQTEALAEQRGEVRFEGPTAADDARRPRRAAPAGRTG
jgi:membrane protein